MPLFRRKSKPVHSETDELGRSSYFYLIADGDLKRFEKEIVDCENINQQDLNGMSLLFFTCIFNCISMAQILINMGIMIDSKDKYGNTPLWRATFECKGRNYKMVELLVKNGANVHSTNNAGRSPMSFAKTVGNPRLIDILNGLDPCY